MARVFVSKINHTTPSVHSIHASVYPPLPLYPLLWCLFQTFTMAFSEWETPLNEERAITEGLDWLWFLPKECVFPIWEYISPSVLFRCWYVHLLVDKLDKQQVSNRLENGKEMAEILGSLDHLCSPRSSSSSSMKGKSAKEEGGFWSHLPIKYGTHSQLCGREAGGSSPFPRVHQ